MASQHKEPPELGQIQHDKINGSENKDDELKQGYQDQYNKLSGSKLKQQKLPACRPIPSFKSTIIIFICFGIAFLTLGVIVFTQSKDLFETSIRYDNALQCQGQATCQITLTLDQKVQKPIYFYYELDNFYQNHRLYVQSKDAEQLAGSVKSVDNLSLCSPITKNSDLNVKFSINGSLLESEGPANPCGLIANSYFNGRTLFDIICLDSYKLKRSQSGQSIHIDETGIAWTSDRDQRFKLPDDPNYQSFMWQNVTDQHFIVWMRTAGLPDFRKLWGKINQDLEPGDYTIEIKNNYDVNGFDGKKKIALAQTNFLGGKNLFLAYCYIAVGGLCLIFAIIFIASYKYTKK